jgi:hypothetical protein
LQGQRRSDPDWNLTAAQIAATRAGMLEPKGPDFRAFSLEPEDGFEPSTPCLQDRCSDQLSYSGLPRMVDGPQACGQFASVSRCGRGSGEVTIARAASQPTTTTSPPSAASTMKWFPVATMISSIARG